MSEDEPEPVTLKKKPGYPFRTGPPPKSRDEALRMLAADELSFGQILDAVEDKLLTQDEAAAVLPSVYGPAAIRELEEHQEQWSRNMQALAESLRQPLAAPKLGPLPQDAQVVAMHGVREELAGVADILRTTGEQIVSMARLAVSTVTNLELVHHETAAQREALIAFKEQSASSSQKLETLTKWLIGFTIALAVLTVVIVVLTGIVAKHDLTH